MTRESGMADLKFILCGRLFNGIDEEFHEGWKILVDGSKIAAWLRDFLADPYAMLDCCFVMKDGVVYATESDLS